MSNKKRNNLALQAVSMLEQGKVESGVLALVKLFEQKALTLIEKELNEQHQHGMTSTKIDEDVDDFIEADAARAIDWLCDQMDRDPLANLDNLVHAASLNFRVQPSVLFDLIDAANTPVAPPMTEKEHLFVNGLQRAIKEGVATFRLKSRETVSIGGAYAKAVLEAFDNLTDADNRKVFVESFTKDVKSLKKIVRFSTAN